MCCKPQLSGRPTSSLQGSTDGCGRAETGSAAAEVDVLGEAGPAVAEVVGDLPGGEPGVVKPGGHGLAERVRGDPGQAGPVQGLAEIAAGVARAAQVTVRTGEDHRGRTRMPAGRRGGGGAARRSVAAEE